MPIKSGTSPERLRLPKGGGSTNPISSGFQPELNSGTGNYSVDIFLPEGRIEFPTPLELSYSSGNGNGPFGMGWVFSAALTIQRKLEHGIPLYTEEDRLEMSSFGELAYVGNNRYRPLIESDFYEIKKVDSQFEMCDTKGRVFRFGESEASRIVHPADQNKIFKWFVSSIEDLNGNRTEFKYRRDTYQRSAADDIGGQLYLSRILTTNLPDDSYLYNIKLEYDFDGAGQQRHDPVLSNRSGFPIETNWRCKAIKVQLGEDDEETVTFGVLPNGTPINNFTILDGNEFEGSGILIELAEASSTDQLAIFQAGFGADVPFLGVSAGFGFGLTDVRVSFTQPVEAVSVIFYGASVTYTLRAYDDLGNLIDEGHVEGVLYGNAQEISIASPATPIHRIEFGSPSAAFGIVEINILRSSATICREYRLEYDDSSSSPISLLQSIQVFGEDPDGLRRDLPPVRFQYTQPDLNNRSARPVQGAPSFSLASDNYEIVDLTGTGTPDLLYTAGANDHKYFLNRGSSIVDARLDMPASPSITLDDRFAMLGDIKGLVAADLFSREHFYRNPSIRPGRGLHDPVQWGGQEDIYGIPVFSETDQLNVRYLDLTGDGRVDILKTDAEFEMWFQRPDHTFEPQPDVDRISSYLDEDWPNISFNSPRIKLADMSGDGFMDIVRLDDNGTNIEYWPNLGRGRWGKKRIMDFDGSGLIYPLNLQAMFLIDVDNNGYADLIYVIGSDVYFWPNQGGKTFGSRDQIAGTPSINIAESAGLRVADWTGCGTLGILWTKDGAVGEDTYHFMNLTGEVKPYLLNRIENRTGGVTEIEYASSAELYHSQDRAGNGWEVTAPFAVHVVSKITKMDSITGVQEEIAYEYRNSYFDREKRQFRGFEHVTVTYKADATPSQAVRGAVEVHHFHQQVLEEGLSDTDKARARALAGRERLVEYFDEDGTTLLKWTRTDWKVVPVYEWQNGAPVAAESDQDGTPVLFPYAQGQLEGTEEGTSQLKLRYESEVRSLQNPAGAVPPEIAASHGQILERRLYGEVALRPAGDTTFPTLTTVHRNGNDIEVVDVPNDTRLVTRNYAINETANLIRVASVVTKDAAGAIVAERHYFYDGPDYQGLSPGQIAVGNLARQTDLVLHQAKLANFYAGSSYIPDWTALGYHVQPLADGSGNGLYIHSQRFRYGEFGLPAGVLSPLGDETQLFYDAVKTRLERAENPLNHAVTATYDYRVGLQTTYTDENGNVWRHVYDGFGRLIKEIEPGDTESLPTRSYQYRDYDAVNHGRPIAIIKHERETQGRASVVSTYQYFDGFLRDLQTRKPWRIRRWFAWFSKVASFFPLRQVLTLRDWLFVKTTYYQVISHAYNPRGGLARETLPYLDAGSAYRPPGANRPTRRFGYDALMRSVRTTNPDGTVRLIERLPWINLVFDEEDAATGSPHHDTPSTFHFDAEENIIQVDRRLGSRTLSYKFSYDPLGNLVHAVDPAANEIRWQFDSRGMLLRMVHPDAGTMLHYYDSGGQKAARLYANGDLIEFTYDLLRRVETRKLGGATPRTETFVYDTGEGGNLIGRLAEVHDAAGTIAFGYDARGREVWQKRTYSDQPAQPYETSLAYDSMGRLHSIDYADGTNTVYRFGINGKIAQVDGLITRINYHPGGQPSALYYTGGARQDIVHDPITHRVERRIVTVGGLTPHDLAYTYDNVGNVTTLTDTATDPGHLAMSRVYTYDDLYRLKSFASSQGHNESYDYDDIGNITLHTGYSPNPLVYPTTGQTSTLLGAQGHPPWQYDANGRLEHGAEFDQLEWDAAQNLVNAIEPDGTAHEFVHSHEGNLIKRTRTSAGGTSETVKVPNKFFSVFHDHTLRRIYLDEKLVAVIRQAGGNSTSEFIITNETGHVVGTVNENGTYNQIEYASYGKRLHQTQPGSQYGFSSKEEVAPNLLAFDHRYMLTEIGRWTQPDPLILSTNEGLASQPERFNPYAFTLNNPIAFVDPHGLAPIRPARGGRKKYYSSPWGRRTDPVTKKPTFHRGVDIPNPLGGVVIASDAGTVKAVGKRKGGANFVLIVHENGSKALYAHVSSTIQVGVKVEKGQLIGRTDMSGRTTGPHLHYTRIVRGKKVDPSPHLAHADPYQDPGDVFFGHLPEHLRPRRSGFVYNQPSYPIEEIDLSNKTDEPEVMDFSDYEMDEMDLDLEVK